MKLFHIFIGACLAPMASSLVAGAAPLGKKVAPFIQTLEAVSTATNNLRQAILDWDGLPLNGIDIIGNSSEVTRQLEAGIERIKGAQRIHAGSELKLKKPSKKAETVLFDTLQLMTENYRRFSEAASKPMVRSTLQTHKDLSAQLNEAMCTKFGPIARRVTRKGGVKAAMWFDEAAEIFAKKKDKKPEEDKKRRAEHPEWKHIQPPTDT